jgi:hypothetical protein
MDQNNKSVYILIFEDTMINQDKTIMNIPITTLFYILNIINYANNSKAIQHALHTKYFCKFHHCIGMILMLVKSSTQRLRP